MKVWFNLFCADPPAQAAFYAGLLGWPEAVAAGSPIYRAVEQDGVQLGFNATPAYALLGLADRRPATLPAAVGGFATFLLDSPDAVDAAAAFTARHGGRVVKPPYATYYGQWQVVLADPEGHVFRAACAGLPDGAVPSAPPR
ncbi:bleomycin resistance protein [Xylophilus sp. Kf1]|nr:bleomycin resistance protein [Xylophilus sp. Kf1]